MPVEVVLQLTPEQAGSDALPLPEIARELGVSVNRITGARLRKSSLDARQKQVKIACRFEVFVDEPFIDVQLRVPPAFQVTGKEEVHIVGAGPAGYFAALGVIEMGLKPVILERGKPVRERRRDLAEITRNQSVNPESNYCFGEGGAGTYSDGKLYTRSDKRGDVAEVLEYLVHFGALPDILIEARPHIGTNKLPGIITGMREWIEACGGEVHFNSQVQTFELQDGTIRALQVNGNRLPVQQVILATGHSSRLIYRMLHEAGIAMEPKAFAVGVRAEHPQRLIDQVQYHCDVRSEFLPPAYYSLVEQVKQRGVYSFCMCPGGIVAPCATGPEEIVTNGWSPSKRNNPLANSGIVVELKIEDINAYMRRDDTLVSLDFQAEIERNAWIAGGKTQQAPAQRMMDFVAGKTSASLPETSYLPGVQSVNLAEIFPDFVTERLRAGFLAFGKKFNGYATNEALLIAPETRTSSPLRIPRSRETFQHPQIANLYPCAEGAGYAGGIVSAAIDGLKIGRLTGRK